MYILQLLCFVSVCGLIIITDKDYQIILGGYCLMTSVINFKLYHGEDKLSC